MNVEANHATLYDTFQHGLRVAPPQRRGSIDAQPGRHAPPGIPTSSPRMSTTPPCVYARGHQGRGFVHGGLNFDAKTRRGSFAHEDIFHSYIAGMDAFALGYRVALKMIEDGRLDAFVENRYASYKTGIGADIVSGKATMEQLEQYALARGDVVDVVESGRQEYLENILNSIMFS